MRTERVGNVTHCLASRPLYIATYADICKEMVACFSMVAYASMDWQWRWGGWVVGGVWVGGRQVCGWWVGGGR
jgi:hypothetical protein